MPQLSLNCDKTKLLVSSKIKGLHSSLLCDTIASEIVDTINRNLKQLLNRTENPASFGGKTYDATFDYDRLSKQMKIVYDFIKDGQFHTLKEMSKATSVPEASLSARLRDFRREKYGANIILKRHVGDRYNGLFEYRFVENKNSVDIFGDKK